MIIWEREPSRYLTLLDPSSFTGNSGCHNSDKAFIVNGTIDKADANFVGSMSFDKIDETGIFIGPYPQTLADIDTLVASGVTAVLNV